MFAVKTHKRLEPPPSNSPHSTLNKAHTIGKGEDATYMCLYNIHLLIQKAYSPPSKTTRLVGRDAARLQQPLHLRAGYARRPQIPQQQMVVSAPCDDLVSSRS